MFFPETGKNSKLEKKFNKTEVLWRALFKSNDEVVE
jgi:hypothetical protein